MPTVPQYNREVNPNIQATPYIDLKLNENMFGANVAKDQGELGKAGVEFVADMQRIKDRIDETKIIEAKNISSQWEQQNLYDKDNGYYYKTGKDAYGLSESLLADYDKVMSDYINKAGLSPYNKQRAEYMLQNFRQPMAERMMRYDYQQGVAWSKNEAELGLSNYMTQAVNGRNDDELIKKSLGGAFQIIDWQGNIQKLDSDTIKNQKIQYMQALNEAVLQAKLGEGNLDAKQYFDNHKNEFNPEHLPRLIAMIKDNELKYQSDNIANSLMMLDPQNAYNQIEGIKDLDLKDAVERRYNHKKNIQNNIEQQAEKEALDGFYNTVLSKTQQGQAISYDDIPNNISAETRLSLMNYVNKNGNPDTDNDIWEQLYDMQVNNAQGFIKEDLNKYRGYLSDGEYKNFLKKQNEIKQGDFYTVIKDDDNKIQEALKQVGLDKNSAMWFKGDKKDIAYSEIRSLVREYEARKGRSINDEELNNIITSLGYKGKDGIQEYKLLEEGMAKRTGFMRDVVNDFVYYQKMHDGKMPSDEEKYKIIQNRVNQKIQENKTQAQRTMDNYKSNANLLNLISTTTPKQNEQRVLTYFADSYVPQISQKLNTRLTVTSRFRNQKGSHHAEGRALDISMSEHNSDTRVRIYEELLKSPFIQAIGTSDPYILAKYNNNRKIVDERNYDRQHGTNHINHAHITLINDIKANNNTKVSYQNNTYRF